MRQLRFVVRGACVMPRRCTHLPGGQDCFFLSHDGRSIGVAGGPFDTWRWASSENPAFFTRTLMKRCRHHHAAAADNRPVVVLEEAYADTLRTELEGMCCVAHVAMNDEGGAMIQHIGDCGVIIVRWGHPDASVVHRTKAQLLCSGRPDHLWCDRERERNGAPPQPRGKSTTVQVEPGDVFVLGSNGLFDNVFDKAIVGMVKRALGHGASRATGMIDCDLLAYDLAQMATAYSRDSTCDSPYARRTSRKADTTDTGGLEDDVCVVVGQVGTEGAKVKSVKATRVEEYFRARGEPFPEIPPPPSPPSRW